ncbi:MAG: hypothetical protein WCZ99_01165 [Candidatus Paceibacterota bacterium]
MPKIEVEHRGYLSEKKFKSLQKLFKKEGKFLGKKRRFSVIYSPLQEINTYVLSDKSPVDLKIRITNKRTEMVLKYGLWSGKDARKEFLFEIDSKKFSELVEFFKLIGFYHGVLQATETYLYFYKGAEIALVNVPSWGYYFEVEMAVPKKDIKKAEKRIADICNNLDLKVLNHKNFCELLKDLNNRPGYRFNFKKEGFSAVKKRFIKYF